MSKSPAFQISGKTALAEPHGRANVRLAVAVAVAIVSLPILSFAHPEIEEQIAHVSGEITNSPEKADLYLRRGHLYRVHRDWEKALSDFRQAAKINPQLHAVERAIGRVYLESDQPEQAVAQLGTFLERQPEDPEGLLLRGRAHAKMSETLKAASDFDASLAKLRRATPALFIERSQILVAGGEEFQARALAGLTEGIERLGDLYTLHRYATELEIGAGQPEAALRRVRQLIAKSNGHLNWQILEAELLASLGRIEEARSAYQQALKSIAALPPHRRKTQAVSRIEATARSSLTNLDSRE